MIPDPRLITDSFYKLHFNFIGNRAIRRNELRKRIATGGIRPTLGELDELLWETRHHEYKFSEVTKHNLQQYIDLLNLYFSFPDMEFHALLVDRMDPGFTLDYWGNDEWMAYLTLARELLERRLQREVFTIIDLQGKPKSAREYLEDTVCCVPHVSGCLRATSDMSVFLQVVDVLLGCVQFDWKDHHKYYGSTSSRADAKRELTAFIKSKLRLDKDEPILTDSRPFRSRKNPSVFTAWKWSKKSNRRGYVRRPSPNGTTQPGHSAPNS